MHRFSKELRYDIICLRDARSMVMTCFLSHNTISYLDLETTQRGVRNVWGLEKGFFCTEESLRNNLKPERRLLYALNLDFPAGREYNTSRNGPAPVCLLYNYQSIFVVVRSHVEFFEIALRSLIRPALKLTNSKLRLLRWIVDFRPLGSDFYSQRLQISFAKVLHRECEDSEFAVKCFRKLIQLHLFRGKLCTRGKLKAVDYLLFHARLCDFDVRSKESCSSSLADYCIECRCFRLVRSVLKYEDTVYYTERAYEVYKKYIIEETILRLAEMSRPENQMSKLRLCRIRQVIHIFQRHEKFRFFKGVFNRPDVSAALRLVWSSIPDCFVSLQEMSEACGHVLPAEDLSRAHSFYEEAIGRTVSCPEPRSLSQYCRTVIRNSLYNSKQWLPDGIKQLNLPPRFQPFLNLETDSLRAALLAD